MRKKILIIAILFGWTFFASQAFAADGCPANKIKNSSGACVCPDNMPYEQYGECRAYNGYDSEYASVVDASGNVVVPGKGSTLDNEQQANPTSLFNRPIIKAASSKISYTLLEGLPGFFRAGDAAPSIEKFVAGLYKFGIWTVGIAASLMLVIGGFMYITSAGNTSDAGKAKGVISDALLGIVVAFAAYLVLYVINPDLVNLRLSFSTVKIVGSGEDTSLPEGAKKYGETYSHAEAMDLIKKAGIGIKGSLGVGCNKVGCTTLDRIPTKALNSLIYFKNACKSFNDGCDIIITGGTELGHQSHGPGAAVLDISKTKGGAVGDFLALLKQQKNFNKFHISQVCTVAADRAAISYNCNFNEPDSQPHYHLSFNAF